MSIVGKSFTMLDNRKTPLASTLRLMITVTAFAAAAGSSAQSKTPGKTYCENEICHRVLTIAETEALIGRADWQLASFYDDCKLDKGNPCTALSSGEKFRPQLRRTMPPARSILMGRQFQCSTRRRNVV